MRTIATILAAMLAVALAAAAFAQTTPKALGWERGQAVPQSAIVAQGIREGPLKAAKVDPAAGLDDMMVEYTDKLGVCSVSGFDELPSFDASEVDKWAERIATKFGGVVGTKLFDLDTGIAYSWSDDLPEGYLDVAVVMVGDGSAAIITLIFNFDNHDACEAEQEAWTQAEL